MLRTINGHCLLGCLFCRSRFFFGQLVGEGSAATWAVASYFSDSGYRLHIESETAFRTFYFHDISNVSRSLTFKGHYGFAQHTPYPAVQCGFSFFYGIYTPWHHASIAHNFADRFDELAHADISCCYGFGCRQHDESAVAAITGRELVDAFACLLLLGEVFKDSIGSWCGEINRLVFALGWLLQLLLVRCLYDWHSGWSTLQCLYLALQFFHSLFQSCQTL